MYLWVRFLAFLENHQFPQFSAVFLQFSAVFSANFRHFFRSLTPTLSKGEGGITVVNELHIYTIIPGVVCSFHVDGGLWYGVINLTKVGPLFDVRKLNLHGGTESVP
ncbi:hypothetical protein CJD36_015535 [Flavipsychrobacter stenotrophus]|uniref:Uncharacterized protein n=1 Tax=Flavipsychrobacter stenotrophus TaxID=2077091 RepID=A0A2S7SU03_9BACT|nr:hypothetical protein CJD36_015535 [Flavipsychrobacter stenotrophus]